jgi:hypothetical protein
MPVAALVIEAARRRSIPIAVGSTETQIEPTAVPAAAIVASAVRAAASVCIGPTAASDRRAASEPATTAGECVAATGETAAGMPPAPTTRRQCRDRAAEREDRSRDRGR